MNLQKSQRALCFCALLIGALSFSSSAYSIDKFRDLHRKCAAMRSCLSGERKSCTPDASECAAYLEAMGLVMQGVCASIKGAMENKDFTDKQFTWVLKEFGFLAAGVGSNSDRADAILRYGERNEELMNAPAWLGALRSLSEEIPCKDLLLERENG